MTTATLIRTTPRSDTRAYISAYEIARERARWSDFDVHVVKSLDGRYWAADEGDYGPELATFRDQIVHTVAGRLHGEY